MTTMTTIAEIHSTRLRVGYVVPTAARPGDKRAWRQSPSLVKLGLFAIDDNNTGVSEVECCRR